MTQHSMPVLAVQGWRSVMFIDGWVHLPPLSPVSVRPLSDKVYVCFRLMITRCVAAHTGVYACESYLADVVFDRWSCFDAVLVVFRHQVVCTPTPSGVLLIAQLTQRSAHSVVLDSCARVERPRGSCSVVRLYKHLWKHVKADAGIPPRSHGKVSDLIESLSRTRQTDWFNVRQAVRVRQIGRHKNVRGFFVSPAWKPPDTVRTASVIIVALTWCVLQTRSCNPPGGDVLVEKGCQ